MQSANPIISIGAFTAKSIELALSDSEATVVVFEPSKTAYHACLTVGSERFLAYNAAVPAVYELKMR